MPTTFSDEAEELRTVVRELLDRWSRGGGGTPSPDEPAATDDPLWATLAREVGVAGILIPERHGGLGLSLLEAHVVLEELGRRVAPVPVLGSVVLATQAVLLADDEAAAARILPGLADGSRTATLAWAEADGRWSVDGLTTRATPDGTVPEPTRPTADDAPTHRLTGVKHHVLDGAEADLLLVAAATSAGPGLFLVEPTAPGVVRRATPAMDQSRPLAVVTLDDAPATAIGTPGEAGPLLERLLDVAAVALSAEQVGGAARALEQTVAYSLEREQFGRPIGSFQALKHRMADLLLLVESARSASHAAVLAAVDGDDHALRRAAGAAGSYCAEAYSTVAGEMIQLHGGIGFTWEHDAHRHFKRAHGSALLFGDPAWQRARVADAVGIGVARTDGSTGGRPSDASRPTGVAA